MTTPLLVIALPRVEKSPLLHELARCMPLEVQFTQWAGHARVLAAAASPGRTVLAAGGDGTLHHVINGLMSHTEKPRVGLLPLGTGNDTALSLCLPFDVPGVLAMCQNPRWVDMDLGWLEPAGVYFVSSATVGFSAHVSQVANRLRRWLPARLVFLAAVLLEVGGWRSPAGRCQTDGEELAVSRFFNANLANLALYGGGMVAAPGASGGDSRLDQVIMDLSLGQVLQALPETYRGRFGRVAGVDHRQFLETALEADRPLPVQADGESYGHTPVSCRVVPRAISFMLPQGT
jgi:diacylglycerol kinase (ATP)